MLRPHSCSTCHHPIGHSGSITGEISPYSFRKPVRSQGVAPCLHLIFSPHCRVKGKPVSCKVHTFVHSRTMCPMDQIPSPAYTPDPILDSSILRMNCLWQSVSTADRRTHFPDLAGFHSFGCTFWSQLTVMPYSFCLPSSSCL
jgi:hypothetical protein